MAAKPSIVIINVFDANQQTLGLGTGFFISDRQIVTNSHVIHDAEYISIKGLDYAQYHYSGTLVDDPSVDLAIIEVSNSAGHSYLPIRGRVPAEGENIVVIGNPEGEQGTVTTGIVSANRGPFFLFSAPISPGSSGSPILDEDGYVLGVVKGSRKDTESQNMNLAVAAFNIGNESTNSPVTQNTPPVDEVPSLAPKASQNPTRDVMWPDGRILTHPEHFVNTGVVKVNPNDTLKLRSGPGTRFNVVAEIPANTSDILAFDQDQVWDGDTWWCPVRWRGFRGYVGRSHLPTAH
jgi:V8-like Glu-specific endopeptidase